MIETDWLDKPYYSLNAYFKHTYGQKIYKIAVNAGLTCPNRDGTLDRRGCIFCSAGGSGDFAVDIGNGVYHKEFEGREKNNRKILDVSRQIERGMVKFNKKVGEKFVIYFQAYTNTYGDVDYLKTIWEEALKHDAVVGISIATRPDCLGEEIQRVLSDLKKSYSEKFIWIELGLQTIHEASAVYIRRHYTLDVYEQAVLQLNKLNIPFITHVILGLPGETKDMMLETIKCVNRLGNAFGIKLQLLHVLKGTELSADYLNGDFEVLSQEDYVDIVIDCLRNLSPEIVVHRVTGDGPKSLLVAPIWSANKRGVLNALHSKMKQINARQGDKFNLVESY